MEDEEMLAEMRKGLVRQMGLVGQFDRHYQRKEELFFPIMECYGHDSPPKVMWGVDIKLPQKAHLTDQALAHLCQHFLVFHRLIGI